MKKARLMASLMVMAMAAFVLGVSSANAVDSANYPPIVTKLAAAFNLSVADVLKVFEADRQGKEAACQAASQQRLSDALSSGTLSQEQYDAIVAAVAEMKAARETLMSVQQELAAQSKGADLFRLLGPCGQGPGGGSPMPPPM